MIPQGDAQYAPDHAGEALKLEADGYAHLFSLTLYPPGEPAVVMNYSPKNTVVWQGTTWEGFAIHLSEYTRNTTEEMSRPKLSLANPEGFFSRYVHRRWVDGAEVIRYRVLGQHLAADINSYVKNTWRVRRVVSLTPQLVVVELGEIVDGPSFLIPGRAFYPPEFPAVSL